MNAGVVVHEEAKAAVKTVGKANKFAILTIANDKEVVPVGMGAAEATFEDFVAKLVETQPSYGVIDFDYKKGDLQTRKVVLVNFIPDTAKPKQKMVFAATSNTVKEQLDIGVSVQVSDASALVRATIERYL